MPLNAFSVDVEDYYQVLNFRRGLDPSEWEGFEPRVGPNTRRLLGILAEAGVRGTFFVLGWVASRERDLVREIADAGHEVASHGWSHTPLDSLDPGAFRDEAERSRKLLEDLSGKAVLGFRAPSFSITRKTLWALDELLDAGFAYDSSVFPVRHPDYGMAGAPLEPHLTPTPSGRRMLELPMTVATFLGRRMPVSGGGYFRLLPFRVTCWGFRQANRKGRGGVFYLHPWELDPDQPCLRGRTSRLGAFRHYTGLRRTESRLRRLLHRFPFGTCRAVLEQAGHRIPVAAAPGGASPEGPEGP